MKAAAYFSKACRICYRVLYSACRQVRNSMIRAVRSRSARDLGERYHALQSSTDTALADYLIHSESEVIEHLMHKYRGRKVLVLSALQGLELKPNSAFQTVWKVCPVAHEFNQGHCLLSSFDALPFSSGAFDVVVLQNVLEYSGSPQLVLKEAARVCDHGGHMIIAGFNPASSHGLWSLFWGRFKPDSYWCRKSLLVHRVKDWLNFLDFNHLEQRNIAHCLPLNVSRYLRLMAVPHRALSRINMPFSPIYCLVSRKDVPGRIGGMPSWRRVVLETALPVTRPVQSTASVVNIGQAKNINNINK